MPESLPVWEIWGFHDEALAKIVQTVGLRRHEGAENEREKGKDCERLLNSTYPKHAQHIKPPFDKTHASRSVVLAQAESVEPLGDNGDTRVSLRLIGAVAGRLDPALVNEIEVTIPAKLAAGRELPGRGLEVFAVVDERDGKYVLATEGVEFMPSGWAFNALETSPDALCNKILASLRKRFPRENVRSDNDLQEAQGERSGKSGRRK